ncbi:MAG: chemotaxis protein CheB [Pseudomonadales bacterium]
MTDPQSAAPRPNADPEVFVVGIGASAGGLAALKKFFASMPADSGLAFVVVVHLAPEYESQFAELLQPHTLMPVQQVEQVTPLQRDHVYVIPPGRNLSTIDTHLRLSDLEENRRARAPIDHFFRTLARSHEGHSIGIILTGTGSDGALGLKAIKERGGLTIVQDPADAEFDGMPQSAVATGLADLVVPLDAIPAHLLRFVATRPRIAVADNGEPDDAQETQLQKIFTQIRARTGRDFNGYKRSTLVRRVRRRMQLLHLDELADYVNALREQPDEVRALADDILITVTNFFRDPEVFEDLSQRIIPGLFDRKGPDDALRVWSVGCASGEEAYSVAMLLLEEAARRPAAPLLQVFASDLHQPSLYKAREGFYTGEIAADVSTERLRRYFHRENIGYRVRNEVRELVVFAPHNLLADPPFSRLDLIICRNLLIYLKRGVQRGVVELFHYALNPSGVLVLGSSETLDNSELFELDDKRLSIYRKRNVPAPELRLPVFPLARPQRPPAKHEEQHAAVPVAYQDLHRRMLEQQGPPSLLLSPDDRAVHLSELVGRYLLHPPGEFTADIFKLVRAELRGELRATLLAARRSGAAARSKPVKVAGDDLQVVVEVQPAKGSGEQGYTLVLFHAAENPGDRTSAQPRENSPDASVHELQAELEFTERQLRSLSEDYEASREEMRASNEELQSSNEELHSTLEELETSKEELQSINEELHTVNEENRQKVAELSQLTDTLHNLMTATDIATLFVDRQLRIVRFTPKVAQIFNVRTTDLQRPLTDLTHRLDYDQLRSDAEQVLRDLTPVEREVFDQQGRYYLAQLRPYRSSDDRIEGVVLTFVDITRRKRSEDALRAHEEQYRALVEASAQIIWTTDSSGNGVGESPGWLAFTGQQPEQRHGFGWLDAVHPGDRELVADNWRQCLTSGRQFNAEFRLHHADSGLYRWVAARAVPLREPGGAVRGWVGMIIDITDRKHAEATRIHFQRLFESAPGLYLVLEPERYTIVTASDAYLEAVGTERAAITGRPLFEMFPDDPDDPQADGVQNLAASLARVKSQGRADVLALQRYPVPKADGGFDERFWSALNAPVYGLDGELAYIIHRVEDVTPFIRLMREQDREAEGHELLESRAEHMQADIALRAAELQQLNEALQSLNETLERRVEERTQQVRELASSLATAEQDERARVGRILHDNLQQLLYGIQLKLALLGEEAATAGQGHLKEYADDAQHWIRDAVNTTRQLSIDLSPPLLSEDKLGDALEWLQSQMLELHQLHVELAVDDAIRLPDGGLRVLLLQSVRELLFNVVKHAHTDRAVVSAAEVANGHGPQLAIQVADQGHGFDPVSLDDATDSSGFGLARMRGRLELFGGRLEVDSQPGAGTRVTIYLPQGEAPPVPATGKTS